MPTQPIGLRMIAISTEKVCFIAIKARQFDVKVLPLESDPGSNAADEQFRDVLEDYPDDPVVAELVSFIGNLNEEEMSNLLALVMIGRGDFDADEWDDALAAAEEDPDRRKARWLLGLPLLGDYLEEGLSAMGYSCDEFQNEHL